jgi:hypothetical protein
MIAAHLRNAIVEAGGLTRRPAAGCPRRGPCGCGTWRKPLRFGARDRDGGHRRPLRSGGLLDKFYGVVLGVPTFIGAALPFVNGSTSK